MSRHIRAVVLLARVGAAGLLVSGRVAGALDANGTHVVDGSSAIRGRR
jgi:hypothetical protein